MALVKVQKGASTIAEYFRRIKGLADDMASDAKKLEDDRLLHLRWPRRRLQPHRICYAGACGTPISQGTLHPAHQLGTTHGSTTSVFGWQPSLAMAYLGQFLSVWLPEVVLEPG